MGEIRLQYGTHEDHIGTIKRALQNNVTCVWSGDLKRNPYLFENLNYCERLGLIKTSTFEGEQESYVEITFIKERLDAA